MAIPEIENIGLHLEALGSDFFWPRVIIHGPTTTPEVIISRDGERPIKEKKVIMFCSANYLGLATEEKIKKAAHDAIDACGLNCCGSALVSGYTDIHAKLEKEIAKIYQQESALVFFNVTPANEGILQAITNPVFKVVPGPLFDVILSDKANHSSLFRGVKQADVKMRRIYSHNDMFHLKELLQHFDGKKILIVTDGLFSMQGDAARLPEIVELAKKYHAIIMVDDAHATAVLGANGRGTCELLGVENDIHIQIGSLSKALAVQGGFVIGSKKFINFLRVNAHSYIFTGTMTASNALATYTSLVIAKEESWRREKVLKNADFLRNSLKNAGFKVLGGFHIVPVLIGDEDRTVKMSQDLMEKNIFCQAIIYPAVPKDEALLRFALMATHSDKHLEYLLETLIQIGKKYSVI